MSRTVAQTRLLAWEDAAGTCNTCPGELEPAESLQHDPSPPAVPWRALGAGAAVLIAVPLALHLALALWPVAVTLAAR
jgi:hypothetical protein